MGGHRRTRMIHCVVAALTAAVLLPEATAQARELKFGHYLPPVHTSHREVFVPWAKAVAQRSGGSLTIKIFPSSQLGGKPPDYYKMITAGVLDIGFVNPGYTPGIFPRQSVLELPIPPKNAQHATRILYGLFDKYLSQDFKDVKMIAMYAVDEFVVITKSKPVRTLADIKGLKIRAPSRMQNRILKALGAVPVNMPITSVYSAMDTGVVDGLSGGASVVFSFKIMDIGRYYTFGLPLSTIATTVMMNKDVWNGLSPEHKKVIDETANLKLSMVGARAYDARLGMAIAAIKKKGIGEIIRVGDADRKEFDRAAATVIDEWLAEMKAAGIPGEALISDRKAID